jgi:hypothetical protein
MAADDPLVQRALDKIALHSAEVVRWKRFVNQADKLADDAPRFPEVESEEVADSGPLTFISNASRKGKRWNPGDFYTESLSGAVRRILIARKEAAGNPSPASVDEIHTALSEGSFDFDTSGIEAQKNGIRISLGKNSVAFVKLPNTDLFGLAEWYGARQRKGAPKKANGTASPSTSSASEEAAGDTAADTSQAEETEDQKQP